MTISATHVGSHGDERPHATRLNLLRHKELSAPWNPQHADNLDVRIAEFAPLPPGLVGSRCVKCRSTKLVGAIFVKMNGLALIPGSDAADPNILCMTCGYWWD
jgi:hypothetical protein